MLKRHCDYCYEEIQDKENKEEYFVVEIVTYAVNQRYDDSMGNKNLIRSKPEAIVQKHLDLCKTCYGKFKDRNCME